MVNSLSLQNRFRGALVGLAIGDALGAAVEFKERDTFPMLTDMIDSDVHNIPAGYWTDDGAMALCLAESLIVCKSFNPQDNLDRYLKWYRTGYYSSNGKCFDIGAQTSEALRYYEKNGQPLPSDLCTDSAGNGSLMRLAPVAMAYYSYSDSLVEMCTASSRTTHTSQLCADACQVFGLLLGGAFSDLNKEELLHPNFWIRYADKELVVQLKVEKVMLGSYKTRRRQISGSGFVIDSLEAALWAFWSTENFHDAVLAAANLGDDADTTAAITGQLAGAYYGFEAIPTHWIQKLYSRPPGSPDISGQVFETFADQLFQLHTQLNA